MTQWDFQNKGKSGWTGKSSFVLKVPLRHLRPSVIYSVPCDQILQRAYCQYYHFNKYNGIHQGISKNDVNNVREKQSERSQDQFMDPVHGAISECV